MQVRLPKSMSALFQSVARPRGSVFVTCLSMVMGVPLPAKK